MSDVQSWERLGSRSLADYGYFGVRCDRARSPRTGRTHDFLVLEMGTWVNVVALTPARRVVMIRQYRHGTGQVGLEIPGGVVDPEDGSPMEAARRELLEETGYGARDFVSLGSVAPNPALQDNRCHSFLAIDAAPAGEQALDAAEDIAVEEVALDVVPDLVRSGHVNHGLVVVAFYLLDRWLASASDAGTALGPEE